MKNKTTIHFSGVIIEQKFNRKGNVTLSTLDGIKIPEIPEVLDFKKASNMIAGDVNLSLENQILKQEFNTAENRQFVMIAFAKQKTEIIRHLENNVATKLLRSKKYQAIEQLLNKRIFSPASAEKLTDEINAKRKTRNFIQRLAEKALNLSKTLTMENYSDTAIPRKNLNQNEVEKADESYMIPKESKDNPNPDKEERVAALKSEVNDLKISMVKMMEEFAKRIDSNTNMISDQEDAIEQSVLKNMEILRAVNLVNNLPSSLKGSFETFSNFDYSHREPDAQYEAQQTGFNSEANLVSQIEALATTVPKEEIDTFLELLELKSKDNPRANDLYKTISKKVENIQPAPQKAKKPTIIEPIPAPQKEDSPQSDDNEKKKPIPNDEYKKLASAINSSIYHAKQNCPDDMKEELDAIKRSFMSKITKIKTSQEREDLLETVKLNVLNLVQPEVSAIDSVVVGEEVPAEVFYENTEVSQEKIDEFNNANENLNQSAPTQN